jgi:hypothetical protein
MSITVAHPTLHATGTVGTPPNKVQLPPPAFQTWDEAIPYLRELYARLRFVDALAIILTDDVNVAQLRVADNNAERNALETAARDVLARSKELA